MRRHPNKRHPNKRHPNAPLYGWQIVTWLERVTSLKTLKPLLTECLIFVEIRILGHIVTKMLQIMIVLGNICWDQGSLSEWWWWCDWFEPLPVTQTTALTFPTTSSHPQCTPHHHHLHHHQLNAPAPPQPPSPMHCNTPSFHLLPNNFSSPHPPSHLVLLISLNFQPDK